MCSVASAIVYPILAFTSFVCWSLLTAAWAIWIVFQGQSFPGWGLSYCFVLCVVASVLSLVAFLLSVFRLCFASRFVPPPSAAELVAIDSPDAMFPTHLEFARTTDFVPEPSEYDTAPKPPQDTAPQPPRNSISN